MKYFIALLFAGYFLSCNPKSTNKVETAQIVKDTTPPTDSNLVMTQEELVDDSVFTDGSKPTSWSTAGITDPNQLKVFIKILRLWVEKGNIDSIANHIQYPLKGNNQVSTPAEFIKNYNLLFTPKVIRALKQEKLSQIFRNYQGAMIGSGELWIRNVNPDFTEEFKIFSINN